MKCKVSVLILACAFCLQGFSQITTDTITAHKNNIIDSSRIRYYDQYLNVTAGWNTRNTEYFISFPQQHTKFVLSPRQTNQFSINLDYSFLFVYYSFTPHVFDLNNEDSIKGSSSRSMFATGASFKRWQINFDYQNIRGYYLKNTEDFIPGWMNGDAYLQFPDLRSIQAGGQIAYNFNKNFSVSSLTSGKEQQLKTEFTFLPILAYWHINIRNEANDVAQKADDVITVNNDINMLLPLSVNIVFARNFYVAAFAGPLFGIDFYKANAYDDSAEAISVSATRVSTGYYLRGSVGYTSKKFYVGFDAFARQYSHEEEQRSFAKYSYGLQAYVGTRFDPPRFLQRTVGWLQKLP
jgi:hypothetical protein